MTNLPTDKFKDAMSLSLHVAGATVRHSSPFSDLEVLKNEAPLDRELVRKYVVPFYLGRKDTEEFRNAIFEVKSSIHLGLVSQLLGDFNWRTRSVGAYFAALRHMTELEENIGKLLLRSDVCYAGHNYCLALASFSSNVAIEFLRRYLDYYLQQLELRFDQSSAMAALAYIGNNRGENLVEEYMAAWHVFEGGKSGWDLSSRIEYFGKEMSLLNEYKLAVRS